MKLNQRKTGVILSYLTLTINFILGVIYTPIMLQSLGQSEYGVYSIAGSVSAFIAMLDLGFGQTMVRYIAKYRALEDKKGEESLNGMFLALYSIIAMFALIVGVIVLTNSGFIFGNKFTTDEIKIFKIILEIMLINLVVSFPLSVFSSILNAYENFVMLKLVSLLSTILKYVSTLIILFMGYKSIGLAIVGVVVSIASQVVIAIYCLKVIKVKFDFRKFDINVFKEIFVFASFVFLNILVDYLYDSTDKIILGAFRGTVAVSIFAVGTQFSIYFQQLSLAISSVFLPKITLMTTKTNYRTEVSNLFVSIGRIQYLLLSFVMSGFIIFGKQFIALWAGSDYSDSYYIALIILLPSLIPLSQNIGISVLRALNMQQFRSIVYIVIAIINVMISIPLAIKYGGIGSAIGTSSATILGQIVIMNWYYHNEIGINIRRYWREIIRNYKYYSNHLNFRIRS